jgi:hypothetical protein
LHPEKAKKAVSEARMHRKWRETSEKVLSGAVRRKVKGFCVLRRQKRLSRRHACSESGGETSEKDLSAAEKGELAGFAS